jgi:hemoglobin/transferrin/lactoferrin receptor protein
MTIYRISLSLLTSLLTVLPATNALAEDTDDAVQLQELRVVGPNAQALLGNNTITPEQIELRNPMNVRDVFAGESSITTSGGADIATKIMVNGIEESLLSVSIDGARQNKSAFHHTGNVLLDPDLLKAVKVTKGLAPADAGPGALGGSLSYETKDAADLLEVGDNFGAKLTLAAGNNQGVGRGNVSVYGRGSGVEFVLSGARTVSSDYKDASGTRITGTGADMGNGIAKLAYTTLGGHRLEFVASKTEDSGERAAQVGPGGGLFARPDFLAVVGSTTTIVNATSKRDSYTLTYSTENPHEWFNPVFQLTYNEQEIDVVSAYGRNQSFSGTFKNEFDFYNGYLTAGLDFFDEKATGHVIRANGAQASGGNEKNENIGIFIQAVQDLGSRFSVSYGARYDWQDFTGATGSNFSASDSGASANASVDVILTDSITFNAGYGWTWGGYELGEAALVNLGGTWTYTGFTTSRANTARAGFRFEHGPIAANVALFNTQIDDINDILPTSQNRGDTDNIESTGLEGGIGYTSSDWFAKMNYTFADVTLDNSTVGSTAYYYGRPVGHIFAFESGWQYNDQLGMGGTAELALENDNVSTTPLSGYGVVNLYGTYEPKQFDILKLRLDVQNLFNEKYSSRASDGLGLTNVVPLNEPGRRFMLTASMTF